MKKKRDFDTELLDRAIGFAVRAHSGMERRGKGFPYIVHPMEALAIVATITPDQELLAAAALHDVVEDTDFTIEDIRAAFGERIAALVEKETDIEIAEQDESMSWHARKQAAIDRLAAAPLDAKIVAIGDKLSNMRAIERDYARIGDELWNLFHVTSRSEHEWHYRGLADSLRELSDTDAFKEFEELIDKVFPK
ncbi:MAG: bifunctional (p)ppGpp synthetase/guanosine-3',5'-bis(diphosphate) 3'-pyrophosphohydrolase [Bacteroidales bacterium]|nr:bifunctional (p)ppGpp synthetase/guanosine-3',5'-bis(diphosphate) 3'-pyrophosphohydrolase [Bacteroidales bacterium]